MDFAVKKLYGVQTFSKCLILVQTVCKSYFTFKKCEFYLSCKFASIKKSSATGINLECKCLHLTPKNIFDQPYLHTSPAYIGWS